MFSNKFLSIDLRILTDATMANYELTPQEIKLVVRELEKHIRPYNNIKAAFIQSRPLETALSMLLEEELSSGKYSHARC